MAAAIENPADCEVRAVIRFLWAKNFKAAEIHREICSVYGENIMSGSAVRQWCRMFRAGRTDVHDEKRSGRPSVVTDELIQAVNEKIRENRGFTITELSEGFPQVSRTVMYEIVTDRLGYPKFSARNSEAGDHFLCSNKTRPYRPSEEEKSKRRVLEERNKKNKRPKKLSQDLAEVPKEGFKS